MVAPIDLPQLPPRAGEGCDPNRKCGNGLEKVYPTCAVRYGYMRHIGEFSYAPGMLFGCRSQVVIQTERGIEIGEMVSLTCSGCDRSINREQLRAYARNSGSELYRLKAGRILRTATPDDLIDDEKMHEEEDEKLAFVREKVRERGIPMKVVACEQIFGGERILYYFMADDRVDFRELVRDLAHEYHTRIEMRQIGHRDEARLVADYEICGRECCCKNFLKTLRPVMMQMAKLQKSTLDPTKVSGRCGRLRCCLRYEHEGYETLNKNLPRLGNRVRVADGPGTVVDRQILTQLIMIEFDNGKRVTFPIEDVLERDLPKPPPPAVPPGGVDRGRRPGGGEGRERGGAAGGEPRRNEGRPEGKPGNREGQGRNRGPRNEQRPRREGGPPPPPRGGTPPGGPGGAGGPGGPGGAGRGRKPQYPPPESGDPKSEGERPPPDAGEAGPGDAGPPPIG